MSDKGYWEDWGPVRTFFATAFNVLWGIGEAITCIVGDLANKWRKP